MMTIEQINPQTIPHFPTKHQGFSHDFNQHLDSLKLQAQHLAFHEWETVVFQLPYSPSGCAKGRRCLV